MTRRERKLAKAKQLRAWADTRDQRAEATIATENHDWAFISQPGHIPARAREIARHDRARESQGKAEQMRQRAHGIERQIAHTIYSDDPDALERIAAKIAKLERQREQMKLVNKLYRANDWPAIEAHGVTRQEIESSMAATPWHRMPFPAYALTNVGAEIRRQKQRADDITRRAGQAAEAEAAGGVLMTVSNDYASVRFAEKPDRNIINELRQAGFYWSGGAWHGRAADLPTQYREETTT